MLQLGGSGGLNLESPGQRPSNGSHYTKGNPTGRLLYRAATTLGNPRGRPPPTLGNSGNLISGHATTKQGLQFLRLFSSRGPKIGEPCHHQIVWNRLIWNIRNDLAFHLCQASFQRISLWKHIDEVSFTKCWLLQLKKHENNQVGSCLIQLLRNTCLLKFPEHFECTLHISPMIWNWLLILLCSLHYSMTNMT